MNRKVKPLRPKKKSPPAEPPPWAGKPLPRVVPRTLVVDINEGEDKLKEACAEHLRLIDRYEPRLTSQLAKILHDKLPPLSEWAGAIVTFPGEADDCFIVPREHAIEAAADWPKIQDTLREPTLEGRLDVFLYAAYIATVLSVELEPALPVTRKEAEAAHLPPSVLFAKGKAFASVGDAPATLDELQAAWELHRKLLRENVDDLLESLGDKPRDTALANYAGVILELGEDAEAVSVVERAKAKQLVAHEPFLLARLLAKPPGEPATLKEGAKGTLLVIVWAGGSVSVQSVQVRASTR